MFANNNYCEHISNYYFIFIFKGGKYEGAGYTPACPVSVLRCAVAIVKLNILIVMLH